MKKVLIGALILALLPMQAEAISTEEMLALVAMPLAVAAVSEVAGLPTAELVSLVMLMNQAEVPPTQFVEVIRYVPVALVTESEDPPFVEYVRQQHLRGVRSDALVTVMADRLRAYDVEPDLVRLRRPPVVVVDGNYIPQVVHTAIARRGGHPHGGPPGQLKKQVGVQTGAEIVHGTHPSNRRTQVETRHDAPSSVVIETQRKDGKARGKNGPPGQSKKSGSNKGKGKGN
jgi:hypothetical protein